MIATALEETVAGSSAQRRRGFLGPPRDAAESASDAETPQEPAQDAQGVVSDVQDAPQAPPTPALDTEAMPEEALDAVAQADLDALDSADDPDAVDLDGQDCAAVDAEVKAELDAEAPSAPTPSETPKKDRPDYASTDGLRWDGLPTVSADRQQDLRGTLWPTHRARPCRRDLV